MAYQIIWSSSAAERIGEILDFLAEENPNAVRRAVQSLLDRVESLTEFPRLGRPILNEIEPDLRRLVVGDFVMVYRIDEAQQTISVTGVRHSRQRSLRGEEA